MRQQPLGVMSLGLSLLTCTRRSITAQSTTHAFICHRQFCLHLETRAKRMLVVSGPSTGVAHPVADGVCLTSCPVCGRSCCGSRRSVVLRLGQRCLGVGLQLSPPCIPPQHHPHHPHSHNHLARVLAPVADYTIPNIGYTQHDENNG